MQHLASVLAANIETAVALEIQLALSHQTEGSSSGWIPSWERATNRIMRQLGCGEYVEHKDKEFLVTVTVAPHGTQAAAESG